ncbi:MAG TPA: hypothetical protein PK176_04545 [Acidobacteriota bacterium]|nr:hypothetical protein [Acidobacteriota bacterium]HQM62557.1 hypothetical protein [Acidobacteriota bacterium]
MSKRTSEQFWRLVLGGFGRRGGDGCVGDEELAMFAAGEPMRGWARRRVARHVARCPACLEQTLMIRRLSGATQPMFHRAGVAVWSAAWRPAATVAAALALAGLLYLGGISGLRGPDQAEVPAVPVTPPPAQLERQADPSAAMKDEEKQSVQPEPSRRKAERIGAPAEPPPPSSVPAAPEPGYAPELTQNVAPAPPAAVELRERKDVVDKRVAKEAVTREEADYARTEIAHDAPAAKTASTSQGEGGAVTGGVRLGLNEAERSKGRTAGDAASRLAAWCQARRPDSPRINWLGRGFFLVEGVLIEEGICGRLGHWPVRRATPDEVGRLQAAAGYNPEWRGVWLFGDDEIMGW